jgi:hypothetical protein
MSFTSDPAEVLVTQFHYIFATLTCPCLVENLDIQYMERGRQIQVLSYQL